MRVAALFFSLTLLTTTPVLAEALHKDDFRIAYETFLANGNLEEAYRIAHKMSTENPQDLKWQRRLARACDWSNRPAEAYKAWKILFRSSENNKEVLKAIKRLANYFNDAPILLELLQARFKAGRKPTPNDADRLIELFERAYRAEDGARYLEQLYHRYRSPYLGKKAAQLYQRVGLDKQALRMYLVLRKQNPADRDNLLTAARLNIRHNQQSEALKVLKTYRPYAKDDDFIFWQLLGDVAWLLQDNNTASEAYGYLALSSSATEEERLRVFELLQQDDPQRAADMSVRFYQAGGPVIWIQRALSIYVTLRQWRTASQVLGLPKRWGQMQLQQNPRYLTLRSQIAAHFNQTRIAAQDMLQAIAQDPEDNELLVSALWLFIDIGDRVKLRQLINELPHSPSPEYWHVLAVSYQELGSQVKALEYYRRLLSREPQNPALQLEFADLLQRSGNAAAAVSMRNKVWFQLRNGAKRTVDSQVLLSRLSLAEQPGDLAARRAAQILHNDSTTPKIPVRQRDELLLSWAIETGWRESARSWVAQRYTSSGEPLPKWAALYLALEAHDHNALQALLAEGGNNLAADSAYDAAMLLDRWPLARKLAFEGLQQSPHSNDLHERLSAVNERYGERLNVSLTTAHYDTLDRSGYRLSLEQAFSETFRLGLDGQENQQSLNNRDTLQVLPDHDNTLSLYSRWLTAEQEWRLAVTVHDELTRYTGWALSLTQQFDRRVAWSASLETRQSIDYSAPLQVAAHADRLSLGLDYVPERHFRLGLNAIGERYNTQYDTYLGSGTRITWEAGYWIRENYPDWSIRLSGDHYSFNADGEPDARSLALLDPDTVTTTATNNLAGLFVPEDDNYYALCSGVGNAQRDGHSRTLRPFADLCAIHSDNFGDGYSLIAGIVGSLDNRDHLSLTLEQSNASMQVDSRNTQIFTLNYQFIF